MIIWNIRILYGILIRSEIDFFYNELNQLFVGDLNTVTQVDLIRKFVFT